MNDDTLGISVRWRWDYPTEYSLHQKQRAREDLAMELFKYLYRPGFEDRHSVIQISEEEQPWDYTSMDYRMCIRITEARQQSVTFPMLPEYSAYTWEQLSESAFDEIKRRFHKFFNTVRVKPG